MNPESPLFARLYLDEDVHRRVAVALQLRGFDAVSAHQLGRWGLTDEEQLAYAAAEGRALFSYNAADYLRLHLEWMRLGKQHAGIVISEQLPVGETARRLLLFLNRVSADELRNQVYWLQAFR